jgi:hypothetical protein
MVADGTGSVSRMVVRAALDVRVVVAAVGLLRVMVGGASAVVVPCAARLETKAEASAGDIVVVSVGSVMVLSAPITTVTDTVTVVAAWSLAVDVAV